MGEKNADVPAGASSGGGAIEPETTTDRLRIILGQERLDVLASSRVLVLGLGGVGSNCVEALARGGVGELVLVDRDVVQPSNINRQAVAYHSTIGRAKTDVMEEIVHDINPACKVATVHQFLSKENLVPTLDALPRPDYVVDAIDTISQKLIVAKWCQDRGLRLISSMGGANKLNPERLRFSTIERTKSCPICKVMRKECRKRGIRGLQVLYSSEVPMPVTPRGAELPDGSRPEKGVTLGTMSYMPPIMGQMIAGRVICDLADLHNDLDVQEPIVAPRRRGGR